MKALDQRLPARIGVRVEQLARVTVAREEPFEPQHIAIVGAADDDGAAGAGLKQPDPAQDQRPHDPLAQLGLFDQKVAQPARRDQKRLGRLSSHGIHQGRAAGKLRQFAHERARTVGHDRVGMVEAALADLDLSRQDEEGARRDFAGRKDAVTGGVGSAFAEPRQPIYFRRRKHRKHLIASGLDQRRRGLRRDSLAAGGVRRRDRA